MKKSFLFILLTIIVNIGLFSEEIENYSKNEDKDRKWTIQTSPHYYIADIFLLRAGRSGKPDTGVLILDLEGQYKINDLFNVSLTLSSLIGFSRNDWEIYIEPMFIYRPLKTGLKGFFIGIYPIIGFMKSYNYDYLFYTDLGIGLNIGYKWIFRNGFTLQLGGGIGRTWMIPSWTWYSELGRDGLFTPDGRLIQDYVDVNFDLKIGYSF